MFCNSCGERADKGLRMPNPTHPIQPINGIAQCDNCGCAINRVGFAVVPMGKRPMTRKERILDRPYRRRRR